MTSVIGLCLLVLCAAQITGAAHAKNWIERRPMWIRTAAFATVILSAVYGLLLTSGMPIEAALETTSKAFITFGLSLIIFGFLGSKFRKAQ